MRLVILAESVGVKVCCSSERKRCPGRASLLLCLPLSSGTRSASYPQQDQREPAMCRWAAYSQSRCLDLCSLRLTLRLLLLLLSVITVQATRRKEHRASRAGGREYGGRCANALQHFAQTGLELIRAHLYGHAHSSRRLPSSSPVSHAAKLPLVAEFHPQR